MRLSSLTPRFAPLRYLLITSVILLAACWLRVGRLAALPPGLSSDESMNANNAFHIYQAGPTRFPFYENYGEPEPLYRFILSAAVPVLGPRIWAFRLTGALIGVITAAAAAWAARQTLPGQPARVRWLAGAAAAAALAAAVGHITLTRSLYRAAPLPLFILLFAGFFLRGLRRRSPADFAFSGLGLALCYYTYTSGFILPLTLIPLAISLLIFERRRWRTFLAGAAIASLVCAALIAPVIYLLAREPQRVLGRAAEVTGTDVATSSSAVESIAARVIIGGSQAANNMVTVWFVRGDGNVQYNTDQAPVVPFVFQPVFALGALILLIRFRRSESALLAALLFATTAPATFSGEPLHGLRVSGAYASFPLVVGAGAGALARLPFKRGIPLALAALSAWGVLWARQTYVNFWSRPSSIVMFGRDLTYGEWFFRPDERDLARWIESQTTPTLVTLDPLLHQTTRAWLLNAYPAVDAAGDNFTLPPETRIAVPWWLELGDFDAGSRHYALFQDGTITLLPPITEETHQIIVARLQSAQTINRPNGDLMVKVIPPGARVEFEPRRAAAAPSGPLARTESDLLVIGWWGPETLPSGPEQTVTYTLEWMTPRPQRHDYRSAIGLLTYNNDRKAGVDAEMTRWLYPTWAWRPDTPTSVTYPFDVPAGLEPGAYRLTLIMGDQLTTLGWVKVAQSSLPAPDAGAAHPNAVFGDSFVLYGAGAADEGNGGVRVSLYWLSNVERSPTDAIIFVHVQDEGGQLVAQADAQPWQGQYPTFIWSEGERVQTDYVFDLAGSSVEELDVWVGMYTFPSLARLNVVQGGAPVKDNRLYVGSLADLLKTPKGLGDP